MSTSVSSPEMKQSVRYGRLAAVCIAVSIAAVLALMVLQYLMPKSYHCPFGQNYRGIWQFEQNLVGRAIPEIGETAFIWTFRVLLVLAWGGYVAAVVYVFRGGALKTRNILCVMVLLGIALAVMWPASLSADSYAYTAFARMQVIHDANPYIHTPKLLRSQGDPISFFARFHHSSMYGPVWTLLSVWVTMLLKSAGIWWQVVGMKLVEVPALILAALAGRSIAERLSPGRGNLSLLAIGLNPLFLIEGPGNGHNDLLMMGLFLLAVAFLIRRNFLLGSLFLGFSAGVKFVTAAAIPWIILEYTRGQHIARKVLFCIATCLVVLVPSYICYKPFWQGAKVFSGVHYRFVWGLEKHDIVQDARVGDWLISHGIPSPAAHAMSFALDRWLLIALFLGLSYWLLRSKDDARWLAAWVVMSAFVVIQATGVWFPWYFTWPFVVSLTRWDRVHIPLSIACLLLAVARTMMYAIPYQPM